MLRSLTYPLDARKARRSRLRPEIWNRCNWPTRSISANCSNSINRISIFLLKNEGGCPYKPGFGLCEVVLLPDGVFLGAGPSSLLICLEVIQMRLPHPLRFSEGGNLCSLHRTGFPSVGVTLSAQRIKSKSQEVESIVSHPLKFAEGGAASVGLIEGWASCDLSTRCSQQVNSPFAPNRRS